MPGCWRWPRPLPRAPSRGRARALPGRLNSVRLEGRGRAGGGASAGASAGIGCGRGGAGPGTRGPRSAPQPRPDPDPSPFDPPKKTLFCRFYFKRLLDLFLAFFFTAPRFHEVCWAVYALAVCRGVKHLT